MTTQRHARATRLAGFTLVEILVVIVIIGLLAGLTTTVVVGARRTVNNSIISTQMAQLSMALDEYKNRYGEYPPDLSDSDAVTRHLRKRWPRYRVDYDTFINHVTLGCDLSSQQWGKSDTLTSIDEVGSGKHEWQIKSYVSSLIFWLGGLPDENGVPSGFYASPKAPLGITAEGTPLRRPGRAKREKPLFTFERKFLGAYASSPDYDGDLPAYYPIDLDDLEGNTKSYIPAYCQGGYPIVYFRPTPNSPYGNALKKFYLADDGNLNFVSCATPYMRNFDNGTWYEEKRFQLIHPGADGMFGSNEQDSPRPGSPATQPKYNLTPEDADNLANFVERGTLESEYVED
ncbi:MAG: prepilin-type N-terminal cleavage/methylation domain-containing protein [Planctomycetia bacterium]|nr:prepilin-type N-terminal cleavage/methylation domain-containing protein [Planctomycetia bacterium]